MCRFTLYLGPPIPLRALIFDGEHSLARQSAASREREDPLNGDGFGIGWYASERSPEPAVFRSITPAWNNRNLANLGRVVASSCILAHVRAATQLAGVNEANCHPFRFGRHLFMHNGDVGNFAQVRRRLLETVCDDAFSNVFGSTDSEHVFALFIDELVRLSDPDPASRMGAALVAAIRRTVDLVDRFGGGEASYLNLAVADGRAAAAVRFTSDPEGEPESLYWLAGTLEDLVGTRGGSPDKVACVSSERLTASERWREVPPNHLLVIGEDRRPRFEDLAPKL
jgi:ergothioneine biosynthesis protein EgtC